MKRILLVTSTAIVSLCTGQAWAQDATPQAAASDPLGEIVVTAQRRTENLQKVPVSASALDASALKANAVVRLNDLQNATPGLSISDAGVTSAINIRGIGLASNSPNVTAGVATYVDGLFQPPIVQANSFYDLASVEVLRGPQGTLVGSNSTGGAIFINSRNPDVDRISGYAEGSAGNRGNFGLEGALNVPLSSNLAVRGAGFYRGHDSYFTDVGPFNNKAGKLDEKGGRIGVLWEPGDFRALLKVQYNDRDIGGYAYRPIRGTEFGDFRVGDIYTLSYDTPVAIREKAFIASLELRQEFANGIVLRSLSGYQSKKIEGVNDLDASQAPGGIREDYYARERQYSEEVNLISPAGGTFEWILGGYFQRNEIKVRIRQTQVGFPTDIDPDNVRTTLGAFAQGSYRITPDVQLQLGGRYSHYKASGVGQVRIGAGIPGFPPGGLPVADLSGAHQDGRVTGKAAINWTVDPDNLLYAFVARGYKPGGFNAVDSEFRPETVWNYEIGWKASLFDRHVRTQISAFYNDYSAFQFEVVEPSTGFNGVQNISQGTIKGIEGQLQSKFGGFSFDANFAYVHSKLSGLTFVNTRAIPSGNLGPQCPVGTPSTPPFCYDYTPAIITTDGGPNLYSPKWTYGGSAAYEFQLGDDVTLTPRVNYSHVGSRFTYLAYSPVSDRIAGYGLLSGIVTLRTGQFHIEAYGTNLTGKRYVSGQFGLREFYGAPREYGIRAGFTF
ncbi:TonB-dependent receptor [Sphingobium vermicomposti]|uniref:Iron complex outermembrane receptor protein n=1 Tax=Sphingobium vermicomposti TaxID=529005 RepID=A0A846M514_9SPHN|nr:TonB-dependent receptor [Sphingobium vermicomposti]NIJ16228.1 iron complex outermembrane receptor protein [Sphingobium vermicomposti]